MVEYPKEESYEIGCGCSYCKNCLFEYLKFEIMKGTYTITCPDIKCPNRESFDLEEIEQIAGNYLFQKHKKFRLDSKIAQDSNKAWCPKPDCETICVKNEPFFFCPKCNYEFCNQCQNVKHSFMTCEEYGKIIYVNCFKID